MSDIRSAREAIFLEHLHFINRLAATAGRRYGIVEDEAEDLAGWVRMRLMEDDYGVLRNFRGTSELKTYLVSVVAHLSYSYVRQLRGQWRPSAAAERLGPPAPALERLVWREGYTLRAAGEALRTSGKTTLSDAELARLFDQMPARSTLRPIEREPASGLDAAGNSHADELVARAEVETRRASLIEALDRALLRIDPEDQLILRLHFGEGHTVADVARAMGLEQKPLYRRIDRLRSHLRVWLEDEGMSKDDIRELLLSQENL